jgi:hypothetical protein
LREIEGDGSQHSEFISSNSFYIPAKGKSAIRAPYAARRYFLTNFGARIAGNSPLSIEI